MKSCKTILTLRFFIAFFALGVIFIFPVKAEDLDRAASTYDSAYRALKGGNCAAAIEYLDKFKIVGAELLKKFPHLVLQIDQQVLECKKSQGKFRLHLRANLDEMIAAPHEEYVAQDESAGKSAGASAGSSLPFILLLLLLIGIIVP